MRIVVLLKQVPDTWGERKLASSSGWVDRDAGDRVIDEISERALEVALSYKDSDKSTEVIVLSMGPASVTDAMRKGLAMGADSAIHVLDDSLAGSDVTMTAAVLAAALRQTSFDLVIAGNESTDGRGGVVPAMVAEHLGLPHIGSLNWVEITAASVQGERGVESGTLRTHADLPAVISITEQTSEARFPNFRGIMTAKRKPLTVIALHDLGLDPATIEGPRSVIVSVVERPARTAGMKIIDEGNAGVELAEFLAARRLL